LGAEDKIKEGLDKVEDDYIDPLKEKVDEYSKKPLSWLEKNGKNAVLIFVGVVVAVGIIGTVIKYLF